MKDIQNLSDSRRINIKKVGVKTVTYPISLRDKFHKRQHTIAVANMYVNLPHHFKGTHMSRFVEILNDFHGDFDISSFPLVLERMKERLEAQASHLELSFPFFFSLQREEVSLQKRYQCLLYGSLTEKADLRFTIEIPISLPPPCLREDVSLQSVSGSWGKAEIAVRFQRFFWIEDLIVMVERAIDSQSGAADSGDGFSTGTLARAIGGALKKTAELRWFSITVHQFRNSCSTFAHLEEEGWQYR